MSTTTKHLGFIPKNRDEYVSGINYYKDNIVQYKGYSFIADPVGYDAQTNPNAYVTTVPFTTNPKSPNAGWRPFALGAYDEVVELGEQAKQFVNDANAIINEYAPIQITGDVTNAADEEDLTSENVQGTDIIRLKDKAYAPTIFSGLGRKYLRKNIQEVAVEGQTETKNILTQEMFEDGQGNPLTNTIYHIQYDYDLNGQTITVPANCVLEFEGGSLSNGTITGNNTGINAGLVKIFNTDVSISGSWNVTDVYPEWLGAVGDGTTDDSNAFNWAINFLKTRGGTLKLLNKTYCISPLDLTGALDLNISGVSSHTPLGSPRLAVLKIIHGGDVAIKIVPNYEYGTIPVRSECGKFIKIENVFLDCNNLTTKGINANYEITLSNVYVTRTLGDGIVCEAQSYPVKLRDVYVSSCGGNGISLLSPYTTCNTFDYIECSGNVGYGIYLEAGVGCTFKDILLQGNQRGGLYIEQKDREEGQYTHFTTMRNLCFINMYTEANGTLDSDNPLYTGNYAVLVKGLTTGRTLANKIDNLVFINCVLNRTENGDTSNITGCVNPILIGCYNFNDVSDSDNYFSPHTDTIPFRNGVRIGNYDDSNKNLIDRYIRGSNLKKSNTTALNCEIIFGDTNPLCIQTTSDSAIDCDIIGKHVSIKARIPYNYVAPSSGQGAALIIQQIIIFGKSYIPAYAEGRFIGKLILEGDDLFKEYSLYSYHSSTSSNKANIYIKEKDSMTNVPIYYFRTGGTIYLELDFIVL